VKRQHLEDVTLPGILLKNSQADASPAKKKPNHTTVKVFMATGEPILLRPSRAASKRFTAIC
jgi:hypothetical protein